MVDIVEIRVLVIPKKKGRKKTRLTFPDVQNVPCAFSTDIFRPLLYPKKKENAQGCSLVMFSAAVFNMP